MIIHFPAQDGDSSQGATQRRDRLQHVPVRNADGPPRTESSLTSKPTTPSESGAHSWDSESSGERTPSSEANLETPHAVTPPSLRIQRTHGGWWDEPRTPTSAVSFDEARFASLQDTPATVATDATRIDDDFCATPSPTSSAPRRGAASWRIELILGDNDPEGPAPSPTPPRWTAPPSKSPPLRKNSSGWWNVEAWPTRHAAHLSWTRPSPPTFNSRVFLPETVDRMVRHRPPRVNWSNA